jgi:magnesium transporter
VHKSTQRYLRDAYDHTIHVIDAVESFRDMLSGLHDAYLSSLSNRMNEIMKVLTIIATLFIPLTFIAGIYGMNFEFMPELKWPWGYPLILGLMLLAAGGLLLFFKRKGWL